MSEPADTIRVFHVDDDPDFADMVATYIEREDDRVIVETASSADEGLARLDDRIDCIISDYDMPDMDGIEFLETIREEHSNLPFILYTGKGSEEVASDAISAGVTDYLQKDSGTDHYALLANRVINAVESYQAQQQTDRYEALIEETTDVIAVVDPEGTFEYLSPATEDVLGYAPEKLVGENGFEYIHPDDRDEAMRQFFSMVEDPEFHPSIEFRFKRQNDSWVWIEARGRNLQDDPRIEGLVVYARDVSSRKEREQTLKARQRQFDAVFNNPIVFMGLLEPDGTIIEINQRALDFVDETLESVAGELFWETPWWTHSEVLQAELRSWIERAADGDVVRFEADNYSPDGQQITIDGILHPIRNDEGEVIEILAAGRDITERTERERTLENLNNAVQTFMQAETDEEVAEIAVNAMRDILDMPIIAVHLYDDKEGGLSPVVATDRAQEVIGDLPTFQPGDSLAWEAFETGEAHIYDDLRTVSGRYNSETAVRSEIILPLGEHGVLILSSTDVNAFDEGDVSLARTVAAHAETALDRAEREISLKQTQRRFDAIFNSPHSMFVVLDSEGSVLRVNETALDVIDADPEDVVGTQFWDTLWWTDYADRPPEDVKSDIQEYVDRATDGEYVQFEARHVTSEGENIIIDGMLRPVTDDDGTVKSIVGDGRDVTERKQRQQELRQYETIVESLRDPVMIFDTEYRIQFVNHQVTDDLGRSAEEILGKPFTDVLQRQVSSADMEQLDTVRTELDALLAGERETVQIELSLNKGGQPIVGDIMFVPLRIDGDIKGIISIGRDITERKEYERELQRYERIIQEMNDGVVIVQDGTIMDTNPQISELIDYSMEELLDKPMGEFIAPEDREVVQRRHRERIAGNDPPNTYEISILSKDGEEIPVEITAARVEYDEQPATVSIIRDLRERKERQRELERQNERLEEFASVVSHDLRNPLNVAEGNLELAQMECASEHLDDVARAHDRMRSLIEDLLSLTQEGSAVTDLESIKLGEATENCWQNVETADATLTIDTQRIIKADPSRFQQLLENLIRNAVEHGGEDVTITIDELDDATGFYVADNGSGISEDERDQVFESGYSTTSDGTGFGLSIVKQVVDAHGWDITVTESEAGGARFEISGVEFDAE